jgi:hypothetical protein
MPIRARLSATRATAISTVTTCARATFGTQKYTPIHMQTRPHTCTPPLVRPSSATAPRRASLAPTAATAIRGRSAASHGLEPGPAAPSQSNEPSRRRPSCSRPHRPPSLVTREEDQPLDQAPATRRCTGCSNVSETNSGEGRCYGSEGCGIDVRDMLGGQRVKRSELWAAGAGFANRCEWAGEGYFLIQGAVGART